MIDERCIVLRRLPMTATHDYAERLLACHAWLSARSDLFCPLAFIEEGLSIQGYLAASGSPLHEAQAHLASIDGSRLLTLLHQPTEAPSLRGLPGSIISANIDADGAHYAAQEATRSTQWRRLFHDSPPPNAMLAIDSPQAWLILRPEQGLCAVPKDPAFLLKHFHGHPLQDQEIAWGPDAHFGLARAFEPLMLAHCLSADYLEHLCADPIVGRMLARHRANQESKALELAAHKASAPSPTPKPRI